MRSLAVLVLIAGCTIIPKGQDSGGVDSGSGLWSGGAPNYHPDGYEDRSVHGLDMKLQAEDCRLCHGDDLTGGTGGGANQTDVDCDSCHEEDWRTNCVYCHGGTDGDESGAPPRDITNETDLDSLSFGAHRVHLSEGIAAARDCSECHAVPDDVLSANHCFDSTAAQAEVDFSASLARQASWSASDSTCSNNYCHGNGRSNGTSTDDGVSMECDSCHGDRYDYSNLSSGHREHLREGTSCEDCHASVASSATRIIAPELHVDGETQVEITEPGFTWDGTRCSGSCHREGHDNERW